MSSFLEYFNQGGFIMYPLALLSIIALAVIVERLIRLKPQEMFSEALIETVQRHLEAGNTEEAISACSGQRVLIGGVLKSALNEFVNTRADIETAIQECAQRELAVLWNNLAILRTTYRIAPLMGLLGTVTGMIGAFNSLSAASVGKEQMAADIKVALITTATGLIIAIPTVVADAYFRARIRKIMAQFESIFIDIIKSVRIGETAEKPVEALQTEPAATGGEG